MLSGCRFIPCGALSHGRAIHIINMSTSRSLEYKILQELWTVKTLDYNKLWIFGCKAYTLVPKDEQWKLESRSRKCIFLSYGPGESFGYRLWDSENRQVVRSADVFFNKSDMHMVVEHPH